ncbi:transmembrane 4 L6 family member 18 isoform X2 [Hemicordylus capensis]|uniref:transmembrane 4 L6 family member 18 isoform X2 n=1 Tax=Hemicordylus capensis TaxID=884348 RepID=UPI002304A8C6|nr:transmembrane 4 L6 family member 18 isoform X2 [Hemicordylus capensis]
MGLQECGGCLSCLLIPLALWSIVVNILLYFPDGKTFYASSNHLTNYVWYFEGICFSGIMMLMLAAFLIILDRDAFHQCCQSESCTKTYRGPFCKTPDGWEYIFQDTAGSYLLDHTSWSQCSEPALVVQWNIVLFSILIVFSGLQILICFLKVIAELKRILCGTYPVFVQPALI